MEYMRKCRQLIQSHVYAGIMRNELKFLAFIILLTWSWMDKEAIYTCLPHPGNCRFMVSASKTLTDRCWPNR